MSAVKEQNEHLLAATFGRRLAQLRKDRQLTQAELAAQIGISRSMIGYYEAWAKNPTLDAVQKVADFFEIPPHLLLLEADADDTEAKPNTKLDRQITRIRRLSPAKQRTITSMIDAFLNTK